jgi:hypothetical protein
MWRFSPLKIGTDGPRSSSSQQCSAPLQVVGWRPEGRRAGKRQALGFDVLDLLHIMALWCVQSSCQNVENNGPKPRLRTRFTKT